MGRRAGGQGSNPPFLQAEPMMAASPVSSGGDVPSPEWEASGGEATWTPSPSDVVVVGVGVRTGGGGLHHRAAGRLNLLFRRPAGCLRTRLEGVGHEGEQQWWDYIFRLD